MVYISHYGPDNFSNSGLFMDNTLRAKTIRNPLRMNTERYRREVGHNSHPLECRLSAGRLLRQKP